MKTLIKYLFKGLVMMSYLIFGMAGGLVIIGGLFYLAMIGYWGIVTIIFALAFLSLFSYMAYMDDKQKVEKNDNSGSN